MSAAAAVEVVVAPWHAMAIAIWAVGEILSVVFVFRVLARGGSPATTLLWMVMILAAPWFGLLLYYLLPRRLQLRRLRRLRLRGLRVRAARPRFDGGRNRGRIPRGGGAGTRQEAAAGLQALLAGADGLDLQEGNDVRWLASGEDFYRAAAEAIAAARHEVHCLVYIFRSDAAGQRFLDLLTAAAQRGVRVRLLFDSLGSFGLKASALAPLRAAGGRAEAFLPLFWKRRPFTVNLRNHRKLLVVDGNLAFVGGRNVGDEYFTDRLGKARRWLDAMIAVRGPAVARLQDVFFEDWCTATDEVLTELAPTSPTTMGPCRIGVACSGPDRDESDLWFALIQALGEARATIELSSPYLVPPPTLLFALELAAARGVRVRLHTNGPKTEAAVLYHAQRSFYAKLLAAGIELYESVEDYNHSKLVVVDGRTVMVGSANMDLRSANLNFEIAVFVLDAPQVAQQVLQTIAEREQSSRRITVADLPADPFRRAIDGFCGLLSPLL